MRMTQNWRHTLTYKNTFSPKRSKNNHCCWLVSNRVRGGAKPDTAGWPPGFPMPCRHSPLSYCTYFLSLSFPSFICFAFWSSSCGRRSRMWRTWLGGGALVPRWLSIQGLCLFPAFWPQTFIANVTPTRAALFVNDSFFCFLQNNINSDHCSIPS